MARAINTLLDGAEMLATKRHSEHLATRVHSAFHRWHSASCNIAVHACARAWATAALERVYATVADHLASAAASLRADIQYQ